MEPLIVALKDSNVNVRKKAAEALEKVGWQAGKDEVSAAYWIGKQNWEECVKLGALAVEPLIVALKDSDGKVHKFAVRALGKIGDARAVEPLIAALKDSDVDVRQFAAEALIKIGTPAVEPLIATLKDNDGNVHKFAAEALGKIGDARAVEPLIVALKDSDWNVRTARRPGTG